MRRSRGYRRILAGAVAGEQRDLPRSFYPFSYYPRTCIGRSLVMMYMLIFFASLLRRRDVVVEKAGAKSNFPWLCQDCSPPQPTIKRRELTEHGGYDLRPVLHCLSATRS
ncbi:hypothetical protein OF83DRAFT_678289 [Amylostereum chailletii]|nr:hypothetical protein OF83DRAFT_678289 [Amylostereum chailletii]